MTFTTEQQYEWLDQRYIAAMAKRAAICAIPIVMLASCTPRVPPVAQPASGATPENVLIGLSLWGTRLAGLLFLLCAVGVFLAPTGYRGRILLAMGASVALMVGAQVLAFVGAHVALIAGVVIVSALVAGVSLVLMRRKWLVKRIEPIAGRDLDGDGKEGP